MKTIREWFAELPKELEEKAVKAVVEQNGGHDALGQKKKTLFDALDAFYWRFSDDGWDFWDDVVLKYRRVDKSVPELNNLTIPDSRLLLVDGSVSISRPSFAEIQGSVHLWAEEKGLLNPENWPKQFIKMNEEVGELAGSILKGKREEELDAFGDCMVVLTILAKQRGVDLEKAFSDAYQVIKDRQGKLVDGTFVKNEGNN
jgi:hypothetical protein